jgi:type I restriction enzyme S subunit
MTITWPTSPLVDLIEDMIGGLWGSPPESAKPDEADVLVVRGADFRSWTLRGALDAAPRRIPIRSLERRQLAKGDLVLEVSGGSPAQPVGRTVVIDAKAVSESPRPLVCSNFCRKLRLKSGVNPYFVKQQLDCLYQSGHTNRFQTSTTNIRNLQVNDFLQQTQVALPELQQQDDLVAILSDLDSRRSSCSSRLSDARRTIARLHQAVLAAACAGRLTADWREATSEAEPATVLVTAIQEARSRRREQRHTAQVHAAGDNDLPRGWVWATVADLVVVATGATPLRGRADYYNGSIPWVTSGATNAGEISTASQHITDLALRETNAKVFPIGTLLVAMYGEGQTRGRVAELRIEAATNQAVAALVFDDLSEPLRPYLRLFFLHNYEHIRRLSFGGVQPNLSLGVIKETLVPLPPLSEQLEIVRRVDHLLKLGASVDDRTSSVQRQVDRSSQAILAKAFQGSLAVGVAS